MKKIFLFLVVVAMVAVGAFFAPAVSAEEITLVRANEILAKEFGLNPVILPSNEEWKIDLSGKSGPFLQFSLMTYAHENDQIVDVVSEERVRVFRKPKMSLLEASELVISSVEKTHKKEWQGEAKRLPLQETTLISVSGRDFYGIRQRTEIRFWSKKKNDFIVSILDIYFVVIDKNSILEVGEFSDNADATDLCKAFLTSLLGLPPPVASNTVSAAPAH